jgi:energy-coupling factor transporter transmembrane protein EcfT
MAASRPVRIDARCGTAAFIAICATALFALSSMRAMAVLLVYVVILSFAVGVGVRTLGRHVLRLVPIAGAIVALNGALLPGDALVSVAERTLLTKAGVVAGCFFTLRLLVLYLASVAFFAATPPVEFATGVYSTLRPLSVALANRAAFFGFLVLSFVPLFADEFNRIRLAQSYRGADFSGGLLRRALAVRALVVPLVLSAIHRSGQLATVVELRGLRDRVGIALPAGRPGAVDIAFAATTAAVLVAVVLTVGSAGA